MEDNNQEKENSIKPVKSLETLKEKWVGTQAGYLNSHYEQEQFRKNYPIEYSINTIIKSSPIDTSLISDGKKTFKQLYNRIEELEIEKLEDSNGNISIETIATIIKENNIDLEFIKDKLLQL